MSYQECRESTKGDRLKGLTDRTNGLIERIIRLKKIGMVEGLRRSEKLKGFKELKN
ncbi:MAG: hypothetical protein ACLFQA_09035 [Bacteroidales bacterium]